MPAVDEPPARKHRGPLGAGLRWPQSSARGGSGSSSWTGESAERQAGAGPAAAAATGRVIAPSLAEATLAAYLAKAPVR